MVDVVVPCAHVGLQVVEEGADFDLRLVHDHLVLITELLQLRRLVIVNGATHALLHLQLVVGLLSHVQLLVVHLLESLLVRDGSARDLLVNAVVVFVLGAEHV